MKFVVKAEFPFPPPSIIDLIAQKTMYGGKTLGPGDRIYLFADKGSARAGLIAHGTVIHVEAIARTAGLARQTPRIDLTIRIDTVCEAQLGRAQLCGFSDWDDGRPETELNFKLYRQATNKVVGISDQASLFLDTFFE